MKIMVSDLLCKFANLACHCAKGLRPRNPNCGKPWQKTRKTPSTRERRAGGREEWGEKGIALITAGPTLVSFLFRVSARQKERRVTSGIVSSSGAGLSIAGHCTRGSYSGNGCHASIGHGGREARCRELLSWSYNPAHSLF